ncbi:hypothetical protein LINPERPRIM_LOCUS43235, partial [Linum perenne]
HVSHKTLGQLFSLTESGQLADLVGPHLLPLLMGPWNYKILLTWALIGPMTTFEHGSSISP